MPSPAFAVGFLVVWVVSSLGLGVVMHRRGYSGYGWGVIGAVLGPLAVVVALFLRLPPVPERRTKAGRPAPGTVDVLVGTDGSAASEAAATSAIDLLQGRIGRVTVAAVAPFDATIEDGERARRASEATTAAIAGRLLQFDGVPGSVVLYGRPAEALRRHAVDRHYDLIAIGSHGHGMSSAVLGSVASELVADAPVPLLVAGRTVSDGRRPTRGEPTLADRH